MPSGHGNWTVSNDGCGGEGPAVLAVIIAGVIALAAVAVMAVVEFAVANAVILALGCAGIAVVVTVSTWVLRRWFTVMCWNPGPAPRRPVRQAVTTVVHVHRHVIEYAPAAIEAPKQQIVTAAVLAAALQTEEIPR
jgi:hypothetical protein